MFEMEFVFMCEEAVSLDQLSIAAMQLLHRAILTLQPVQRGLITLYDLQYITSTLGPYSFT